jgi:hypothetical protein
MRFFRLAALFAALFAAADECPPPNFDSARDVDLAAYIAAPWFVQRQEPLPYQPAEELFCVRARYLPINTTAGPQARARTRGGGGSGWGCGAGGNALAGFCFRCRCRCAEALRSVLNAFRCRRAGARRRIFNTFCCCRAWALRRRRLNAPQPHPPGLLNSRPA